jgi:hypothetical protein
MMIFPDKAKVMRYMKGTKSPTGASSHELKTLFESLPCYLESEEGIVIVPQEGQVAVYYVNMYCNLGYGIKANDIIINIATGEKFKVVNASDYSVLPHSEIRLQGGTIQ